MSNSALALVPARPAPAPPYGALATVSAVQLEHHAPTVYLASLAPGSRRTMRQALETIARLASSGHDSYLTYDWPSLRFQHTQLIRTMLSEYFEPATANKMLSALRGTLLNAWRLRQIETEDYQRAVDIKSVSATALPKGRALKQREIDAIFTTLDKDRSSHGWRDRALIALLMTCGLRRAEVVALDLADYDRDDGEVKVLHGKGNKARTAYAGRDAREMLDDYLEKRGDLPGPLFLPAKAGRKLKDGSRVERGYGTARLTSQAVWAILRRRGLEAGIENFTPHDLRRTLISYMLEGGADISTVQRIVGHSSPTTTARYDRRGEKAKKAAAEIMRLGGTGGPARSRRR